MSHLGDRITPLVDSQLPADAAERAHGHLAGCRECHDAVEAERLTKARLAMLGSPEPGDELMRRLLQMAGPAGPLPPRAGHVPGTPRPHTVRPAARPAAGASLRGTTRPPARPVRRAGGTPAAVRPAGRTGRDPGRSRLRLAVAVGAFCLVGAGVAAGTATALGGGPASPAVVPPVDSFVVQHNAATSAIPLWAPTVLPTADGR